MTGIEYILALPIAVFLAGTAHHVFRGVWRPFAPKGDPSTGLGSYRRYRSQSKWDFFMRDAFSLEDILFRIDLNEEGFYDLASLRNLVISIFNWAIGAALIYIFLWDRFEPVYYNLVDTFMESQQRR